MNLFCRDALKKFNGSALNLVVNALRSAYALLRAMSKVEEAIFGLRHSQNLIVALGAIVLAVIVGLGVYSLQRIDSVNDKVTAEGIALRKEISGLTNVISMEASDTRKELIGITTAIANSITAARQPPQPGQLEQRR